MPPRRCLRCAELGSWEAVQLDKELLKAEVRPGVFEDVCAQADEETRLLLANTKVHQHQRLHADALHMTYTAVPPLMVPTGAFS